MAQEIKKQDVTQPMPTRFTDPFAEMRAEMDRVFDSFLGRGPGRLASFFGGGKDIVMPSIDVRENDKEIVVEAELPGAEEKDVLRVTLPKRPEVAKAEKRIPISGKA